MAKIPNTIPVADGFICERSTIDSKRAPLAPARKAWRIPKPRVESKIRGS
jgi:hypothetical protein